MCGIRKGGGCGGSGEGSSSGGGGGGGGFFLALDAAGLSFMAAAVLGIGCSCFEDMLAVGAGAI